MSTGRLPSRSMTKQRDDVAEPGAAASELQGRRELAEREHRLTSRLR
jgi:hypothetical protein